MPELDAAVAPKPASAVPSPAVSSASSTPVPPAAPAPAADLLRPLDSFARRHLGSSSEDIARMLDLAGYPSLDALIDAAVPADIRLQRPLRLPAAVTESEALAELTGIAAQNDPLRSYIGQGYYGTLTPAVIQRNILENPGWYTAYTPYQAEIAQGRMEALINFQTMVCDLTGLEIANASMLDEATAAAEAMHLCLAAKGDEAGGARRAFFVAQDCHPQTVGVIKTRAVPLGVEVVVGDPFSSTNAIDERFFGALVQYPGTDGAVRDYAAFVESAHAAGALVVAAADPLALCVLRPPGEWGADVAVGSTQRFGVPMGGGGPHAAYFATRDEFKRLMPGRLVGISKDSHGKPAYRLSLQTREQHIRRDKATSNICTAQVLLAVMASMYAVYHGPEGLRKIAHRVRLLTGILADELRGLGYEVGPKDSAFFDTLTVRAGSARITEIHNRAEAKGINLRRIDASTLGISLDETVDLIDLQDLWQIFHGGEAAGFDPAAVAHKLEADASTFALPDFARRESPVLTHDVFNRCHTETEMLRYVRRLESRDLSLTHSMIPLGSCTMKLNATTEMFPVTWTEFGGMHPFAPPEQTAGYRALSHTLEKWLAEITGFAAVSLQPNAGSQGEYAGLLAIHRYHESRGESERDICLIPTSAHGTNPASASMAGLKVVTIKCDAQGNIDLADLRAQAGKHAARLSCLMVTYPSTHGVFEAPIREICAIIHERGGQVYMDGANMNAQVGLCRPGDFGADVCHLNLHKTFCIPHGGGGPGVGPIGVAAHLVPFLPGDPREGDSGAVSAAPLGSASILVIPWLYIAMMGPDGLTQATKLAILNANYIARQLEPHYPVLYRGAEGHVAHECILDLRGFKATAGIEVEDVAKRLMDYGFHAPTISWPVAGTMMVEPTESESKAELDRFCDAMIAIRQEIRAIETGESDRKDNVLKNAPHTAASVTADEWPHAYPRSLAAYPAPWTREHKFWPAIGRVDNVYGDRNLVCTCLPMEAYGEDS